jgi:2-dehydro-3-deoxygluconokinase
MPTFIFGEAMLEYHSHGGAYGLRYGGDTLNTAIHMARMGLDVAYVTAVGTDPISEALVAAWANEGVDTRYILRHPSRSPGIYAIHVDAKGERSFLYWRDKSAAREMFTLSGMTAVLAAAESAPLLYFSLISLAILPEEGKTKLINLAAKVRHNGGKVAYDSNFRPNLWPSLEEARRVSEMAMSVTDIGLPTNVDEQQLNDDRSSEKHIAIRWHEAGCDEVIVKAGENGCLYSDGSIPARQMAANIVTLVDSSGAGDAFNAGYLASRIKCQDVETAIQSGQSLASWVVQRSGAIPSRDS